MKQCTRCGKEYPDKATQCAIDAYPLASAGPASSKMDAAEDIDRKAVQAQPDWIDRFLRSRRFWCGLLLILYFLPALLAGVPIALALPWVLIPNAHVGLSTFLGMDEVSQLLTTLKAFSY